MNVDQAACTSARQPRHLARSLPFAVSTFISTSIVASLISWNRLFTSQPLNIGSDNLIYLNWLRNVQESGWFQTNPNLAYPFGQTWRPFPMVDAGFVGALEVLGRILPIGAAFNLIICLAAATNCLSAHLCLVYLKVDRWVAAVLGVAFATLPFFFWRAQVHLNYATYWAIPVLFVIATHFAGIHVLSRRRTLVCLAFVASAASNYYIVFGMFTVGVALAIGLANGEPASRRRAVVDFLAVVGVTLVLPLWQLVGYLASGDRTFSRPASDVELFALRISDLLLPYPGHPASFLSKLRDVTDLLHPVEGALYIGCLALVGLAWALRDTLISGDRARGRRLHESRLIVSVTVVIILVAVPSGIASIAAAIGFSQIRAWNRVLPMLAFLGLYRLGLGVTDIVQSKDRLVRRAAIATLVVVVLVDQGPAGATSPFRLRRDDTSYGLDVAAVTSRVGFASAMASLAGTDQFTAFVFPLLPYHEVPPLNSSSGSDQVSLEIFSGKGRWTPGALHGSNRDLSVSLGGLTVAEALNAACSSGFDFFVYDLDAVVSSEADADLSFLRSATTVRTSIADEEGHFIAFQLSDCVDGQWPPLEEVPRVTYVGDGTYGEFRAEVDSLGVYRSAPPNFDLMVHSSNPTNAFDLVFDVVPTGQSLSVSRGESTFTAVVRAGESAEVRVPLCMTSLSERLEVDVGGAGRGSGGPAVKIRHMRVLPVKLTTTSRDCDSVTVAPTTSRS